MQRWRLRYQRRPRQLQRSGRPGQLHAPRATSGGRPGGSCRREKTPTIHGFGFINELTALGHGAAGGTSVVGATYGSPSSDLCHKCDRSLYGVGVHGDADGYPLRNTDLGGSSGAEYQTTLVGAEGLVLQILKHVGARPRSEAAGVPNRRYLGSRHAGQGQAGCDTADR